MWSSSHEHSTNGRLTKSDDADVTASDTSDADCADTASAAGSSSSSGAAADTATPVADAEQADDTVDPPDPRSRLERGAAYLAKLPSSLGDAVRLWSPRRRIAIV